MSQRRSMVLGVALAALLVACGGGDTAAEETSPAEETTTAAAEEPSSPAEEASSPAEDTPAAGAEGATTVATTAAEAGEILVDGEGRSLYRFLNDTEQGASTCVDACLDNWPILDVEGEPEAGEGADAAALGTLDREDGATQVTYDGWPLYFFAGDAAPGDTNGQGVGDVWYLVAPDGSTIDAG